MTSSSTIEMVVDLIDHTALRPEDLPTHPTQLLCGRCGVPWGHHRFTETCPAFQRPALPDGYRYVDELVSGERFSFLSRRLEACPRTVLDRGCCVGDHLIWVTSSADRCEAATHWVHDSAIVVLEPEVAAA